MNLPERIVIDGVDCETRLVLQAPGRCVRAQQRINEFKIIMGTLPEVLEFVADLEGILRGDDAHQPWESEITTVEKTTDVDA